MTLLAGLKPGADFLPGDQPLRAGLPDIPNGLSLRGPPAGKDRADSHWCSSLAANGGRRP